MKDNIVHEADKMELDIIQECTERNKLEKDFFPVMTYDLVQSGYPVPNHGIMVARPFGGTNAQGELLNGGGMWCKVEDVKKLLETKYIKKEL